MFNLLKNILFTSLLLSAFSVFADSDGRKDALVIIDMQPYFAMKLGKHGEEENSKKLKEIIKAQKEAIKAAKVAKIPIIFIEYDIKLQPMFMGMHAPIKPGLAQLNSPQLMKGGPTHAELTEEAKGYKDVVYIKKTTDGMFNSYNSGKQELVDYLAGKNIGNLIIMGANGGECVKKSINGALNENYSVIAYSKGIADFNHEEFLYPYKEDYELEYKCQDCKFRSLDDLSAVLMEMGTTKKKKKDTLVNDSKRDLTPKEQDAQNSPAETKDVTR